MGADVCARCGAYVYPKYNDVCLDCGFPLAMPSVDEVTESPTIEHPHKLKTTEKHENIWLAILLVYAVVGVSMALLVYIWK